LHIMDAKVAKIVRNISLRENKHEN